MGLNKYSVMLIVITGIITTVSIQYKYYEYKNEQTLEKMSIEKTDYVNPNNPYYVNDKIEKGEDIKTNLIFFKSKNAIMKSQRELDNGKYDEAIKTLESIQNDKSINVFINDLKGDIYFKKQSYDLALEYYKLAYNETTNNDLLKDLLFNKLQYVKSKLTQKNK